MGDIDYGQPAGPPTSKAFIYVPVIGTIVILAALALGFTGVIPEGLGFGVAGIAVTAIVAVAWSAGERHPASWTRAGTTNEDEDEDAR